MLVCRTVILTSDSAARLYHTSHEVTLKNQQREAFENRSGVKRLTSLTLMILSDIIKN